MSAWIAGLSLVAWLLLELVLRRGAEARSWDGGAADRSSTRIILLAYGLALALPFVLGSSGVGSTTTDSVLAWIGVAVALVGLGIRIWSMRVLGAFYTRSLRVQADQTIVDRGPYGVVRHPGYLGSLLVWVGSRLALNWLVALATALLLAVAYTYRISSEETMLGEHFGNTYAAYQHRTWRLLPYVW